jgi:Ca2+-binding RTX toxin-like protein
MAKRSAGAVVGAVLLLLGSVGVPVAHADGVPGMTDFSGSGLAHCTTLPASTPFDVELRGTGSNPVAVTVGESISISFTYLFVPGAITSGVVTFRVRGPVSPSGDVTWYPSAENDRLTFKATGAGTTTIELVHTQGYVNLPRATGFTLCDPPVPIALTSFTATPDPVCLGLPATIVGSSAGETLRGTTRADVIYGGGGDDTITARGGDDVVCGAHGNDTIDAGGGKDRVDGGYANDRVVGQDGADWIDGGSGADTLDGGPGIDTLRGGIGTDVCTNGETLVSC